MLKLSSSSLDIKSLKYLVKKQAEIDSLAVHLRAKKAKSLWDSKKSSKGGKEAFETIVAVLSVMCVSTELCNYCEQNEATDIEHIYPKSFFPEKAFQWQNYLLACGTCNTHYKLDQFAVFMPAHSSSTLILQRKQPVLSIDAAFIDPRVEDPMDYLTLDIIGKTFYLTPRRELTDPRSIAKAMHTLNVLQIGRRNSLVAARKAAFTAYQDRLEYYKKVRDSNSWEELEQLVQDPHDIDKNNTFAVEQQLMLDNIKNSILNYQHPTVWQEMKRQHHLLKKTKKLFEDVSDALTW